MFTLKSGHIWIIWYIHIIEHTQDWSSKLIFKRSENYLKIIQNSILFLKIKALSRVKSGFKSVPLQFYFEIAELASAKKWREIQNMAGEDRY